MGGRRGGRLIPSPAQPSPVRAADQTASHPTFPSQIATTQTTTQHTNTRAQYSAQNIRTTRLVRRHALASAGAHTRSASVCISGSAKAVCTNCSCVLLPPPNTSNSAHHSALQSQCSAVQCRAGQGRAVGAGLREQPHSTAQQRTALPAALRCNSRGLFTSNSTDALTSCDKQHKREAQPPPKP